MHTHLRSGFLGVVIVLSLVLAVFIIKTGKTAPAAPVVSAAPTEEEYQANVRPIVMEVLVSYPAAKTAEEREQALSTALNQLLDVRVPKEEKELHLELAVSLELARSGAASGWKRFLAAVENTAWLK